MNDIHSGVRSIVVTGASSGIGARTAQLLAARGHRVVGAARRTRDIERLPGVVPVALDLADPSGIAPAHDQIVGALGRPVEVLVNCAGYGEFGSVEDTPIDEARRQLEVNVLGAVALTRHVLPAMRAAGAGRIVNVSSLAGEFAAPLGGWYHASKFALEALSDSLRGETRPFGIDVAVVQPGYVDTRWHDEAMSRLRRTSGHGAYSSMVDAMARHFASAAVRRQMCTVDQVAETVAAAATAPRPRTRYRVGRGANLAVALASVLPDRWFDAAIRKQFGYP